MPANLISKDVIRDLAAKAAGLDNDQGNPRLKKITNRLLVDLFNAIDDLDITMDEFWSAVSYLGQAGKAGELGLIVPGIAVEHFLDLRLDEAERRAGLSGGTLRTIEGPLYVAGAPLSKGEARMDDGTDPGEIVILEGQVRDTDGKPVAGAIVDAWHANSKGSYSFFDPEQKPYNLRRRVETDAQGRYRFRSIMPCGYGCPPGSSSRLLMESLGRHAERPAHIHFFVSAPGHRLLTTQINFTGDKYLYDDFAFGTREGLIVTVEDVNAPDELTSAGLNQPFKRISFDFAVTKDTATAPVTIVQREHFKAA
jgi:catechol 1,2-dioxygenase